MYYIVDRREETMKTLKRRIYLLKKCVVLLYMYIGYSMVC